MFWKLTDDVLSYVANTQLESSHKIAAYPILFIARHAMTTVTTLLVRIAWQWSHASSASTA